MTANLAHNAVDRAAQILVLQSALFFCTVMMGDIVVKALVQIEGTTVALATAKVKCLIVENFRCRGPEYGRNTDGCSHQR